MKLSRLVAMGALLALSGATYGQIIPVEEVEFSQQPTADSAAEIVQSVQGTPVQGQRGIVAPKALQDAIDRVAPQNVDAVASAYDEQFAQPPVESERDKFAKKIAQQWKPTQTFDMLPSENIVIPVARGLMNSIATNFTMLAARTSDEESILEIEKGYLYVTINSDQPVGLILYEDGVLESQVSVTLWPLDVPASMIKLDVSLSEAMKAAAIQYRKDIEIEEKLAQVGDKAESRTSDHNKRIIEMLTPVAQGDLPRGFTLTNDVPAHFAAPCTITIHHAAEQRLTGGREVIDVVLVTNDSDRAYHVREEMCLADGVLAVAIFEKAYLQPGESSEIYILRDKLYQQNMERKQRRPRLTGGAR